MRSSNVLQLLFSYGQQTEERVFETITPKQGELPSTIWGEEAMRLRKMGERAVDRTSELLFWRTALQERMKRCDITIGMIRFYPTIVLRHFEKLLREEVGRRRSRKYFEEV